MAADRVRRQIAVLLARALVAQGVGVVHKDGLDSSPGT